jgi:hypothetical protein
MSAALETYLTRLYLDTDTRRAFLADPRTAAAKAGLDATDVAALEQIDRVGLELAAHSFAAKRAAAPRRDRLARLVARLRCLRWR